MIYFVCKSELSTLKLLVVHFKVFHLLKSHSTYECLEESCHSFFQCLNSFKRHITNKHVSHSLICISNSSTDNVHNVITNVSSDIDVTENNTESPITENEAICLETSNPFNIDVVINGLYKSAIIYSYYYS